MNVHCEWSLTRSRSFCIGIRLQLLHTQSWAVCRLSFFGRRPAESSGLSLWSSDPNWDASDETKSHSSKASSLLLCYRMDIIRDDQFWYQHQSSLVDAPLEASARPRDANNPQVGLEVHTITPSIPLDLRRSWLMFRQRPIWRMFIRLVASLAPSLCR